MSALHFFDTNILLYTISANPIDQDKRERASVLLEEPNGALSVQVLQEFYVQATRPTRLKPLSREKATEFIRAWQRFPIQEINLSILNAALDIQGRHRFSYWDSAIIAAAQALGCRELYTEDMSDGQRIGDLVILNPFR